MEIWNFIFATFSSLWISFSGLVSFTGNTWWSLASLIFALDFSGHGYSEGETALIKCADDLIDDAYLFVNYILEN